MASVGGDTTYNTTILHVYTLNTTNRMKRLILIFHQNVRSAQTRDKGIRPLEFRLYRRATSTGYVGYRIATTRCRRALICSPSNPFWTQRHKISLKSSEFRNLSHVAYLLVPPLYFLLRYCYHYHYYGILYQTPHFVRSHIYHRVCLWASFTAKCPQTRRKREQCPSSDE